MFKGAFSFFKCFFLPVQTPPPPAAAPAAAAAAGGATQNFKSISGCENFVTGGTKKIVRHGNIDSRGGNVQVANTGTVNNFYYGSVSFNNSTRRQFPDGKPRKRKAPNNSAGADDSNRGGSGAGDVSGAGG